MLSDDVVAGALFLLSDDAATSPGKPGRLMGAESSSQGTPP